MGNAVPQLRCPFLLYCAPSSIKQDSMEPSTELTAQLILAVVTLIGVITAFIRQEMAKRTLDETKSDTGSFRVDLKRLLEENDQLRQAEQALTLERDALRDVVRYVRTQSACKAVVDEFIERRNQQKVHSSNEH